MSKAGRESITVDALNAIEEMERPIADIMAAVNAIDAMRRDMASGTMFTDAFGFVSHSLERLHGDLFGLWSTVNNATFEQRRKAAARALRREHAS